MKRIAWMLLAAPTALAQTPPVGEIMARVAANQAKSVEARKQFVYKQEELIALRRSNGTTECQGKREYTVTPGPSGAERRIVKAEGLPNQRCSVNFQDSSGNTTSFNADDGAMQGLSTPMGQSKDGIPRDLFPLTAKEQRQYEYKFESTETYKGRSVYRISFHPNHHRDEDGDEGYWKGEAIIDAAEYEPVSVTTDLTAKVPAGVRIFLGTNVHGVGFSVSYQRVAEGVWFPASFGGEFKLNVLFFYRRSISVNVKNSDFKRTDVNSDVAFDKIQ